MWQVRCSSGWLLPLWCSSRSFSWSKRWRSWCWERLPCGLCCGDNNAQRRIRLRSNARWRVRLHNNHVFFDGLQLWIWEPSPESLQRHHLLQCMRRPAAPREVLRVARMNFIRPIKARHMRRREAQEVSQQSHQQKRPKCPPPARTSSQKRLRSGNA